MLEKLMYELEKKENFFSSKGNVDTNISEYVEHELNVKLPESYKQFLENWGFAIWFGHCICGVSQFPECSTINYTKKARSKQLGIGEVADLGIVVTPYDAGGYYFMFCEKSLRPGEIVLFDQEVGGQEVESWKKLEDFIKYLIEVSP